MRRIAFAVWVAVGCLAMVAGSVHADFYLHKTLDVSEWFNDTTDYGDNPSAVTTDGSSLWVAGYNFGAGSAGVIKISDPFGPGKTMTGFASVVTPDNRGFSGLAYDPTAGVVLAAYDDGAADDIGITGWNPANGDLLWSKNARGGSSVGNDPGFLGADAGAGWTTFGSGRRALQNSTTGADIYTTADGMIINGAGTGTFWRDMDFAPDGDLWLREGNQVIMANRTGGNSVDTAVQVVVETDADFVNGQNIAYLDALTGGDQVVYNARSGAASGQSFFDVAKMIEPDGTASTWQFVDGNGGALASDFAEGAAYYDFEWDAAGQTLLVSDFSNRAVYQFKPFAVPEPATLGLLALGGLALARRRRS